jgi:serine/arginine repetitive matrix protein 2
MYNGIGLQSARGSATSGHITKNLSHVKPNFYRDKLAQNRNDSKISAADDDLKQKHNTNILDHKKKREIENKVFEYEESLRDENVFTEDEISDKSTIFRNKLLRNPKSEVIKSKSGSNIDSHEMSYRKNIENKKMKDAFGIRDGNEIDKTDRSKRRIDNDDNDQKPTKRTKYIDK